MGSSQIAKLADRGQSIVCDEWVGALIAIGGMACKYSGTLSERQLVIAISVPIRDFAAELVAAGWIVSQPIADLGEPLDLVRHLEPGTPIRMVTPDFVVSDTFVEFRESDREIRLKGSQWQLERVTAIARNRDFSGAAKSPHPGVGQLADWSNRGHRWDEKLAQPSTELSIVGTKKWLSEELAVELLMDGQENSDSSVKSSSLRGLLFPYADEEIAGFARVFSAGHFHESLPIGDTDRCNVLDGTAAIRHAPDITSDVIVCIVDRSIGDEGAAETLHQLRYSGSETVALSEVLGWSAPPGIEAAAFLRYV